MSDIKTQMQVQFGANAANYVASKTHRQTADLERAIALVPLAPTDRLLDLATGGGHTALAFAPHVAEVVATDLTPRMLDAAANYFAERGATNISTELADAEALPFADHSFDVVTCRTAAHHFPNPAQFVAEVERVLRPGGHLVLIDNSTPADPDVDTFVNAIQKLHDSSHVRAYSAAEWSGWCEATGLHILHSEMLTKRLEVQDWCDRASVPTERRAAIQAHFAAAVPTVREALQPASDGSTTSSFDLPALLVIAQK